MGLHLLLIWLLLALAGCGVETAESAAPEVPASVDVAVPRTMQTARTTRAAPSGHAGLACASCHDGELPPDRDIPVATTSGCLACHTDGGPSGVRVSATTTLPMHANHPGLGRQARMECAQCHAHPTGTTPLQVDINGCGLCHIDQLDADPAGECTACHVKPEQRPLTSQALAVPHSDVPWIEGGCVRCHFSVAPETETVFAATSCTTCHADGGGAAMAWPADLVTGEFPVDSIHGGHTRVTCSSCHTTPSHRIEGMSSAVGLVCADCHAVSHDLGSREVAASVCVTCHTDTHQAQQGMVLGLVPWQPDEIRPSVKFAAGITCRGCHGVAAVDFEHPDTAISGDPDRCVSCHLPEYRTVLDWWKAGGEQRLARARAWVAAAGSRAGVPEDSVATALERLAFVEAGGFVHGPRLADRLMRDALRTVGAVGADPPAAPDLGAPPREGLCSYCHLEPDAAWSLDEMPDDFHRDALARR